MFYGILALVSLLGLGITQSAKANYIVTFQEVGSNVVATGSGAIDLTGLQLIAPNAQETAGINPSLADVFTGPVTMVIGRLYISVSGPTSLGNASLTSPNSGSGDLVGIGGHSHFLFVPPGYVSGNALSDTSTYNNKTFADLGITPGTYTWTWGTGADADSFTLQVGSVPDGGSTVSLLGLASFGLVALRRKLRC